MKTKFLPLLLLPFLAACSGGKEPTVATSAADLQLIAAKCSELSGYTGQAAHVEEVGVTFVFRSDGEAVAECEWTGLNDVKLIHLLHPDA